ncbi:MAG: acetyltransferase [Gammaproteobacteria bacterium]|nr:acetyltransferase [Gammaproteobacteria bacterium]|tara:strand:- start:615 stop:1229 length:615 start_codon:yes stop_codon:yes gene_type:complete
MKNSVSIIGYSGHGYVCLDIINKLNIDVNGYYDLKKNLHNPYGLNYLGLENNAEKGEQLFVSVGDNLTRKNITLKLSESKKNLDISLIHPNSSISKFSKISNQVLICSNVVINTLATIKTGCIINSSSVIEHECFIDEFSHIAPSATLCGNVKIGKLCLIGANSVILPNLMIGDNTIIGAGTVVTKNIPPNSIVYGKYQKIISK